MLALLVLMLLLLLVILVHQELLDLAWVVVSLLLSLALLNLSAKLLKLGVLLLLKHAALTVVEPLLLGGDPVDWTLLVRVAALTLLRNHLLVVVHLLALEVLHHFLVSVLPGLNVHLISLRSILILRGFLLVLELHLLHLVDLLGLLLELSLGLHVDLGLGLLPALVLGVSAHLVLLHEQGLVGLVLAVIHALGHLAELLLVHQLLLSVVFHAVHLGAHLLHQLRVRLALDGFVSVRRVLGALVELLLVLLLILLLLVVLLNLLNSVAV